MNGRTFFSFFYLSCLLLVSSCETKGNGQQKAIQQQTTSYVDAYNQRDAEALAQLWAKDGEYIDPETGTQITGRGAIQKEFASLFSDLGDATMAVKIEQIAFPQSDKAIEKGVAIVKRSGEEPSRTAFTAVFTKEEGKWMISQVREVDFPFPSSHFEHLKDLEWLIGYWVDQDEDVVVTTDVQWDRYKNFITQKFSVNTEGTLDLEGRQVIAWDPYNETIRSWVFDSDGGFGEGMWTKKEKSWVVETEQTLADGQRASAINIYTPIDNNSYTWESTGREVGGELLPNVGPVTVVRKKR